MKLPAKSAHLVLEHSKLPFWTPISGLHVHLEAGPISQAGRLSQRVYFGPKADSGAYGQVYVVHNMLAARRLQQTEGIDRRIRIQSKSSGSKSLLYEAQEFVWTMDTKQKTKAHAQLEPNQTNIYIYVYSVNI